MRCFPLLASVLDEIWAELPGSSESEKVEAIRAKEEYLRSHYARLATTRSPVDYSDPATRYVYLCCYVASHANLVTELISKHADLRDLFVGDRVQVTSIGGGPGSDLLGILKHIDRAGVEPSLKVFLYDREQTWSEAWSDVDDKVGHNISAYFLPFDVTDSTTWKQNAKYLTSDLFTMIYFASEIHGLREQAAPFFRNLFKRAKPGALFLYVDNASDVFFNWFDKQCEDRGVSVLASEDNAFIRLPNEEEKRDLGKHYDRIGGQPKITANVAYRVLRKDER